MKPPILEHFADLEVELGEIMEVGSGRAGTRRIIPIVGGSVKGKKISGEILNLGADWQTIFSDKLAELDTRYAFKTDDGALIEVINYGYRHGPEEVLERIAKGEQVDPDSYYMRTHARLETGDERYSWVNRMLFVGTGERRQSKVHVTLFAVK